MIGEQATTPEGLRWTRQRELITSRLSTQQGFITAQELHSQLRRDGHRIGKSTVYRTFAELGRAQRLDIVRQETGERRYRLRRSPRHGYHLVCRGCGATTALDAEAIEGWVDQLPQATGFSAITHRLELSGVCTRCMTAQHEHTR
ncbi:transcriptional repressor [Nocardia sp. NPDC052254]|uniref:Fur family transcriptional regulator n=1 Tax=Nocardia sp. NPDC052254 TaxID=3155681 RepID=UPI003431945B